MTDADRCPNCGAERPEDAPEGLCPRCLMENALGEDTPVPAEATAPAPAGATREWADEPGGTPPAADGRGDVAGLPRGETVHYFGDYEIRRELGRGGMGVVYEARQISLNRPVALKMVKAGLLAGDDELRRFQNEAEAVALLDHPGVVPVYEVGAHRGQRYFSMKLVSGGSLVPLLDRYKVDPKAAAALAAEAAEAVAHAHMRGILHRDLKPANILVDGEGHPHVTDFGLAKRVEADVDFTISGAILGTPAYMAPEQATGRRGSITTATDVYGLGSVLFALLTGKAPFGGVSVVETLDAVRNNPPEPPTRLNAKVPRDLETICLKCLEKDPRRRYPTVLSMADDLRAWLDSRPITARRVGPAERAWLWCKRKPAVAALAAGVVAALVGGAAAVIAVQANANGVLREKNAELTDAYGREAEANAKLAAATRRVEQRYELAVDAIKTFHTGVSEDFLLKQVQFKELRDRLLKSAGAFYGKLGALLGEETDSASRRALAQANFELADLIGKVGRSEDALAAHRAVLAAREALAAEPGAVPGVRAELGRSLMEVADLLQSMSKPDEALAGYRRTESVLGGLAIADPAARAALADCRARIGSLLSSMGRYDEALDSYRLAKAAKKALAGAHGATNEDRRGLAVTLLHIGALLPTTGELKDAEAEHREALAIYQKLADDNPAVTAYRKGLADSHTSLGKLLRMRKASEAEEEYREALAIYQKLADDNPAVTAYRKGLADSYIDLGNLLLDKGKPSEAEGEYREGRAIYQKLADDDPAVTGFRVGVAASSNNLAVLKWSSGKPSDAEVELRKSLAILRKLADDSPANTVFRGNLAAGHAALGQSLQQSGQMSAAEVEFREALAIRRKLAEEHPTVTSFRSALAGSHTALGGLLWDTGKLAVEDEWRKALAINQTLANDNPADSGFGINASTAHNNLGALMNSIGRPEAAEAEFREALVIWRKRAGNNPAASPGLVFPLINHAKALVAIGKTAEAEAELREALAIGQKTADGDMSTAGHRVELAKRRRAPGADHARSRLLLGHLLLTSGDPSAAEAEFRESLGIYQQIADENPKILRYRNQVAVALTCTADSLRALGRPGEALKEHDKAVEIGERLVKQNPTVREFPGQLASSLRRRGLARRDLGDMAGAAADAVRALEYFEALPFRSVDQWFETACCRAALSGLAGVAGSEVSDSEGPTEADRAMDLLRKAVDAGHRHASPFRTDPALDPLRDRPDFRLMMMDVAMPADPFAR